MDPVTGPYGVILLVETEELNAVGQLVDANIHGIPGVTRTITCLGI